MLICPGESFVAIITDAQKIPSFYDVEENKKPASIFLEEVKPLLLEAFPKANALMHVCAHHELDPFVETALRLVSSPRQIYSQIFACCIAALNGCAAYFAPLLRS